MKKSIINKQLKNRKNISFLIVFLLLLCSTTIFAQQITVRGKVLDENGESITGVTVLEKGTINGVSTDADGNYTITATDAKKVTLQFSFVGYTPKEEVINERSTINVALKPSVANLDEVVVIGYGTQTRREITGSVTNITEKNFRQGVTRTAADLLQGKVAGLSITSGSGSVNTDPVIRLRGISTLSMSSKLYYIISYLCGQEPSKYTKVIFKRPYDIRRRAQERR
ncbi:MAG: carboxypeptidase-like regulatory domain-containing protein [Dysgonamonadaceae bacterium]|jgi:iron complex outermembrane receptor protein|nr:carboxypeptidase-like regulatory domain-containing protein [Dysgonamonadaceae bacterium]